MDKIAKAIGKLSTNEKIWVKEILSQLRRKAFQGLDVKKLKGREDIFRVRKGDIRILYQTKEGQVFVLSIERRNEKTYK